MKILIIDDEVNIRESLKKYLQLEGMDSETAGDGLVARGMLAEERFDAIVLDLRLPGMGGHELLKWIQSEGIRSPVIMISAHGEIPDAVTALKNGAADYLSKPFDPAELVLRIRTLVSSKKLEDRLEADIRTASSGNRLIGESPAVAALRDAIGRIAESDSTVLITGESGTGKEVAAREIHALGTRAAEPFVAVNIGGIHESLMESELFGHERGAFTGAVSRKIGLFELAGDGTLFLDEIGEMPSALQVKMLRVLQDRKIRRLGGTSDIPVKARIVSATNRDIEQMVRDGLFREDLYYRLNVIRMTIPPLRERAADIPLIAGHLVGKISARMNRTPPAISDEVMEALSRYPFPGNVRELENIIERALIYCSGNSIAMADIDLRGMDTGASFAVKAPALKGPESNAATSPGASALSLDETERTAITAALARHDGNRTRAAQDLGISRRTIINKIKRYGLA